MLRELGDLRRRDVGPIRDRIVVQHARQRCRTDDRAVVRTRLAPIRVVHVGRQGHEPAASSTLGGARQRHTFGRRQTGDAGDDRHTTLRRIAAHAQDLDLFVEREGRGLTERPSGTIAPDPLSIIQSTCRASASWSTE